MIPLLESAYASKGLYQEMLSPLCRKYDLTDSQVVVLLYLADPNPADTATEIVRKQRLKKSVVSMSVDDLQSKGLIESYYRDGNRRTKHLKVTDAARPIVREARKIQDRYYELLTQGLKNEEKDQLNGYLERINTNISGYGT